MPNSAYFNDSLQRGISSIAYNNYGPVAIGIYSEGTDVAIKIYDVNGETLRSLNEEDQAKHLVFNKLYNVSALDFNVELTVFATLEHIISDVEKTVYESR